MGVINSIVYETVVYLGPVLLCVLGGLFAYKANVLNIALEGMMLMGAFMSVLTAFKTESLGLSYLMAVVSTMALGLVFSFFSVKMKGNVIVIGLAINMLVPAIAGFVMKVMALPTITLSWFSPRSIQVNIPIIKDIPVIGPILSGHPPLTYISYLMIIIAAVILYKTRFGVYVRVTGENEEAAISLGLKTNWYKTAAILIGALCCGLAGANISMERLSLFTNNMTASRGFIAIAAIYCGRGKPIPCTLYTILFAIINAVAEYFSLQVSASLLLKAVPYFAMVAVLSIASAINRRNASDRGAFAD
ncbi:MAG: ABC transporter permease [Lachnospiraceae bacterium]|nr:ABC transporter permease [Lachnospiraceae bacterium]